MGRLIILILFIISIANVASPAGWTQTTVAGLITGTVKDQTGAVIAGAQVTIRNSASGETRTSTTDDAGRFSFDKLIPGAYTLSVAQSGFKQAERGIAVEAGRPQTVEIRLEVAAPKVEIDVGGKGSVAGNADPNYRALRDGAFSETYNVNNLTLKRDVGTLTLRSGRVSFFAPVMGRVVKAVFVGDGSFVLEPAPPLERKYLRLIADRDKVDETFEKAVLCFTDDTYKEIKSQAQAGSDEPRAADVIRDFNNRARFSAERVRSLAQDLGASENIEALILADIYNPRQAGFFSAYIFGRKDGDLRYHVRPRGALPQLLAPEEVALINVDPGGEKDGVWYLAHSMGEYQNGTASSNEDKRSVHAQHYRIETVIDSGQKLTATAELRFTPVIDGERVIGFGLLPNLRVSRVALDSRDVGYVQESRKQDGSFYAVTPEPLAKGKEYKITIEYQGNKVVRDEGGGNFAVGARESWYPSVNVFQDHSTFDLTFKVPAKYTLVGVGKLVKSWREGDFGATQWVSEVPLAVAGFNYGLFKKKEITDADTKYQIEGYATSELPDYLREASEIGGMTPTRLVDSAIVEAQNSMRLFTHWFGEAPYGRIAITQQPQPFFGQSWPTLVYLPIISFFDSTQRWMLMGGISKGLNDFIQEVTPHEVSHQWWGHIVGWSSYHDQWLSEGFADFSAGLYLEYTEKTPDKFLGYWKTQRDRIIRGNQFGHRATDVGPIWMGLRLRTFKTAGAYNDLVYPKGGYVLYMLRSMMRDRKTGDQPFIDMMHDFVKTYFNQNASTEDFKRMVEKHMTPNMDLDGNKRMDWFFNEWVYGTEVPRYRLDYSLTQDSDGKCLFTGAVTQSEVSEHFKMLVPLYVDFDGKLIRLGEATVNGNSKTQEFKVKLPQKPKRVVINPYYNVLAVDSVSQEKK